MGCDREQGRHYQCECMRERMAKLEEALRFYADKKRYQNTGVFSTSYQFGDYIEDDGGRRARAVLREPSEAPVELEEEE